MTPWCSRGPVSRLAGVSPPAHRGQREGGGRGRTGPQPLPCTGWPAPSPSQAALLRGSPGRLPFKAVIALRPGCHQGDVVSGAHVTPWGPCEPWTPVPSYRRCRPVGGLCPMAQEGPACHLTCRGSAQREPRGVGGFSATGDGAGARHPASCPRRLQLPILSVALTSVLGWRDPGSPREPLLAWELRRRRARAPSPGPPRLGLSGRSCHTPGVLRGPRGRGRDAARPLRPTRPSHPAAAPAPGRPRWTALCSESETRLSRCVNSHFLAEGGPGSPTTGSLLWGRVGGAGPRVALPGPRPEAPSAPGGAPVYM